jgi:S-phase kinase-associated protein 1
VQEIPLPNVKNHVLVKVIEFCKHHKTDPMNEIEKVRGRCECGPAPSLRALWDDISGTRGMLQPLKSANMHEVVQDWYANFVGVEQELLFELILAANYMDIKPLLDLTCATVASMIKGKRNLAKEHKSP